MAAFRLVWCLGSFFLALFYAGAPYFPETISQVLRVILVWWLLLELLLYFNKGEEISGAWNSNVKGGRHLKTKGMVYLRVRTQQEARGHIRMRWGLRANWELRAGIIEISFSSRKVLSFGQRSLRNTRRMVHQFSKELRYVTAVRSFGSTRFSNNRSERPIGDTKPYLTMKH